MNLPTSMIKGSFNFKSALVCDINLISLEEILYGELKFSKIENSNPMKIRWNEFKGLNFHELAANLKFKEEYKAIKNLIIQFCNIF